MEMSNIIKNITKKKIAKYSLLFTFKIFKRNILFFFWNRTIFWFFLKPPNNMFDWNDFQFLSYKKSLKISKTNLQNLKCDKKKSDLSMSSATNVQCMYTAQVTLPRYQKKSENRLTLSKNTLHTRPPVLFLICETPICLLTVLKKLLQ